MKNRNLPWYRRSNPFSSILTSPGRMALVSFVMSELITQAIVWITSGEFSLTAFIIAGICSVSIAYVMSAHMLRQQQTISDRNDRLRELARELRSANKYLSERNAQLDAFAHTVAHDLQTPLNTLRGLSRLLEENHASVAPDTARRYLRVISRTSDKMSRIVDDLLLLSTLQQPQALSMNILEMGEIVAEAERTLQPLIEKYNGRLVRPREWPAATGYGPWVEQIWVNYISNALKYGGEPPRVEVGANVAGDAVRFWVRDNGPGLAPEQQSRLFSPFTRLDQTRAQGQGLGLSIVRQIAERLGGTVGVESSGRRGEGSTFYFTLRRPQKLEGKRSAGRNGTETTHFNRSQGHPIGDLTAL